MYLRRLTITRWCSVVKNRYYQLTFIIHPAPPAGFFYGIAVNFLL